MSIFSDRMISLRKGRGLSQYEFSRAINISRSTISGYETEGKEPNYETLCRFADFYGVSTDYLLGKSDEPTHADAVFQKDSLNFKKRFDDLPPDAKVIVTGIFDDFYVLLFRDVCAADKDRLTLYRDLMSALQLSRSKVKKLIEENTNGITDAVFLNTLMEAESSAKTELSLYLDKLMQSDLNAALKKGQII
ncbi:MAG: helix-turn-helix transcriptional regulator [Oscillospiraceae bacterium]|nr:helix-turn-helix transcriptional regulator [Oscillospiraceae bacterium]